jgi:hypothetical protein
LNGQTLTNATLITTPSNTDLTLTPSGTGLIKAGKGLNMNSLPITNLSTLNGHNIYSFGNFTMNTTQTLAGSNTPTRVKIDTTTSGATGITLDAITNIGRLTFANAGTYNINYRGYFVKGGGSSTTSWIWARKNGTDVVDSATSCVVNNSIDNGETQKSTLITLSAADYLEFWWAADNTNAPLTYTAAITSPYARPSSVAFGVMMNIVA